MQTALIMALALGVSAPALKDKPKPMAASIVGEWSYHLMVHGGAPVQLTPKTFVFGADGKALTQSSKGRKLDYDYEIDLTTSPPGIAFVLADRPRDKFVGVYQIDGDWMTLCVEQNPKGPRPAEFTSPANSSILLVVLKRSRN